MVLQGYAGSAAGNRSVNGPGQDPIAVGAGGRGLGRFGAAGGGGGAYGGMGGVGFSASGGSSYGDVSNPSDLGSGGGGALSSIAGDVAAIYREASVVWNEGEQGLRQRVAVSAMVTAVGGAGGGLVRIKATSVVLNGSISADGMPGTYPGAGGGSGGTVWIDTKSLIGPGSITANGGCGLFSSAFFGGGGSGGRIKINCRYCRRAGGYFNHLDVARQRFSDTSLVYSNSYIDIEGRIIITYYTHDPNDHNHHIILILIRILSGFFVQETSCPTAASLSERLTKTLLACPRRPCQQMQPCQMQLRITDIPRPSPMNLRRRIRCTCFVACSSRCRHQSPLDCPLGYPRMTLLRSHCTPP